jgi:hypothetical protein
MGGSVAFLLDGRRDHLVTSPKLAVAAIDDPYKQFAGKHAFTVPDTQYGVFDVTATGRGIGPFTFHLVIGEGGRIQSYGGRQATMVLQKGELIVQEYPPITLPRPAFELVQDAVAVGAEGGLLDSNQPVPTRRAYRAAQLGAQLVSIGAGGSIYVVVADVPPSFRGLLDGGTSVPQSMSLGAGDRFAAVFIGDGQQVSWSVEPVDSVVRLPDAEVGPQPPGATLVPFRVMVEGTLSLSLQIGSRTMSVPIQAGDVVWCLPLDFPRYPLAQSAGGVLPVCTWNMASNDSQAQVVAFYKSRLNRGDWRVISTKESAPFPPAAKTATITFARRSDPAIGGTLEVDSDGDFRVYINVGAPTPS